MGDQVKLVIVIFLLGFFLLSISSGLTSEIYKWKDKDGNIFFSDSLPPSGVDVEIKKFKDESTDRPKTKGETPLKTDPPQKTETPRKMVSPKVQSDTGKGKRPYTNMNVVMYMTSWCPYCVKAREYIRSLDVNLVEYNIEKDKSRRQEMMQKSGGSTGVPLIDVEGIIIRGFSPSAIKAAIESKRSQ